MPNINDLSNLGSYISFIILNNKLYKQGRINEEMKNKILLQINTDYKGHR